MSGWFPELVDARARSRSWPALNDQGPPAVAPACHVPGVVSVAMGTAARSHSAFIGSGPNRWRAWKITDFDGGL